MADNAPQENEPQEVPLEVALENIHITLQTIKFNTERLKQLQSECFRWNMQHHQNLKTIMYHLDALNKKMGLPPVTVHEDPLLAETLSELMNPMEISDQKEPFSLHSAVLRIFRYVFT